MTRALSAAILRYEPYASRTAGWFADFGWAQ